MSRRKPLLVWFGVMGTVFTFHSFAGSIGHEIWFSYYLTCVISIALIVSLTMRDTKRHSAIGT